MGVDAEMFARIKGRENWLPDERELEMAVTLSSTIGARHFLISSGMSVASWNHHALSIVRPANADDVDGYEDADELLGKVVWFQDGQPIIAADDEQFVRVHLMTRYYGEDYARGDWPTIRAVAEWLELHLPTCEVWYGGDSSGFCAEHLSADRRDELNRFYLASGHSTYTRYAQRVPASSWLHEDVSRTPVCPTCHIHTVSNGGGGALTFYWCDGCGQKAITDGRGGTHWFPGHVDTFKAAEEVRTKLAAA